MTMRYFLACFLLAAVTLSSMPLFAQSTAPLALSPSQASTKPLVVIRFNQRNVYFEKPLATAINKALQVKPNAVFELVELVPMAKDEKHTEQLKARADANLGRVVAAMRNMGVSDTQMKASAEEANVPTDEVHIYVQ